MPISQRRKAHVAYSSDSSRASSPRRVPSLEDLDLSKSRLPLLLFPKQQVNDRARWRSALPNQQALSWVERLEADTNIGQSRLHKSFSNAAGADSAEEDVVSSLQQVASPDLDGEQLHLSVDCPQADHPGWDSLAPNIPETRGTEILHNKELPVFSSNPESSAERVHEDTDIATALSLLADKHLGLQLKQEGHQTSQYVSYLLDTIDLLQSQLMFRQAPQNNPDIDVMSRIGTEVIVERPARLYETIHRTICEYAPHGHRFEYSEDEPRYATKMDQVWGGLRAQTQIQNLEHYIEQHPDASFIVVKEHLCSSERVKSEATSSERQEQMLVISSKLDTALRAVADFVPYETAWNNRRNNKPFMYGKMDAPYLFIFHHHSKLHEHLEKAPDDNDDLTAMLRFIDDHYGEEYTSAQTLFAQGKTTAEHVTKLFKPLTVAVDTILSTVRAYVVYSLPEIVSKAIQFTVFAYINDGRSLVRQTWKTGLTVVPSIEMDITDLRIYPLSYARPDVVDQIRRNGKQFLDLRSRAFVCYQGWDDPRTQFYVSTPLPAGSSLSM